MERVFLALGVFLFSGVLISVACLGVWQLVDAPGIIQVIVGCSAAAATAVTVLVIRRQ